MTWPDSLRNFYNGRPVCVTGGAGFVGSHLVDALIELGADVRVIDDLSNGRRENLQNALGRIQFIEQSILDESAMQKAVDGATVIFHQAAMGSVPRSVEDPAECFRINADGTLMALEAAREAGAERFIYAASSSAYGGRADVPTRESAAPDPASPYAASKLAGEHLVSAFAHCYGMSGMNLRYFNIFGPRQRPDSPYAAVIPLFVDAMRRGTKPVVYGDGGQTRDFTFVTNAVYANLLAGACEAQLAGDTVNIGCGERYSLVELIEKLANMLNARPDFESVPARKGDVRHSQADITAARKLLGYGILVGFEEGLRRTIASESL